MKLVPGQTYSYEEVKALQASNRLIHPEREFIFYDCEESDTFIYRNVSIGFAYSWDNTKKEDDEVVIKKLIAILSTGKRLNPIVLSSDGLILDGHHRYAAYVKTGATRVPAFIRSL